MRMYICLYICESVDVYTYMCMCTFVVSLHIYIYIYIYIYIPLDVCAKYRSEYICVYGNEYDFIYI